MGRGGTVYGQNGDALIGESASEIRHTAAAAVRVVFIELIDDWRCILRTYFFHCLDISAATEEAGGDLPVPLAEKGNLCVSAVEQEGNAVKGALPVGRGHRVQTAFLHQASVRQDDGDAPLLGLDQEHIVSPGGVDDESVHLVLQEALNGISLSFRVFGTVRKKDLIAGGFAHAGDPLQKQAGKGAAHIPYGAADQHGPAGLQTLSGAVGTVIQLFDHLPDILPCLSGNIFKLSV